MAKAPATPLPRPALRLGDAPPIATSADRLADVAASVQAAAPALSSAAKAFATVSHPAPTPVQTPAEDRIKTISVTMPARIVRQLDRRASDQGKPRNVLILEALQAAGYEVADDDLRDRRGSILKDLAKKKREG